ncbi:Asp-tRNA(Asn)/Glu-tRNA(Gln) amidotransferase subunit GatB [soil metagenome]
MTKPYLITGRTGEWEVVLGLEVHAQVASNAKLFSGAAVGFGAAPNSQVSLVDAGFPGMLPVINRRCVEQAVRTGLGLKAKINLWSRFDRKNYFYPDLPQGYQISQFKDPIVGEGALTCELDDGSPFTVGIERLHLEQDAGKSIHDMDPNATYVDLNRSGTALMEIVSRPHMRSPEEAAAYVKTLRTLVRYLGTCDGDMEKGNLRADVNVSVCRLGQYEKFNATGDFGHLGTRCEIKNVNSLRFIQQAIVDEAARQVESIEDGGTITQETRLFDAVKGETRSMRSKEEAHDYRYFPDPDLLPLELDPAWVDEILKSLPELPDAKRERLQSQHGLSAYDAKVLAADAGSAGLFDRLAATHDAKLVANTITQSVATFANAQGAEVTADGVLHITAEALSQYLGLIEDETVSSKTSKDLFKAMEAQGAASPADLVAALGLAQTKDTGAISAAIEEIVAANPDKAAAVKDKPQAIGWFVGQVMKATGGKANPAAVNELLKAKLGV